MPSEETFTRSTAIELSVSAAAGTAGETRIEPRDSNTAPTASLINEVCGSRRARNIAKKDHSDTTPDGVEQAKPRPLVERWLCAQRHERWRRRRRLAELRCERGRLAGERRPGHRALVAVRQAQQRRLIELAAEQLHADRQCDAIGRRLGEPRRHRQRGEPSEWAEPVVAASRRRPADRRW